MTTRTIVTRLSAETKAAMFTRRALRIVRETLDAFKICRISGKNSGPDAVTLVNRQRTSVAGDKFGAVPSRSCGDQRVVCRTAGYAVVRQSKNEILVGPRAQAQERLRKSYFQEFADDNAGSPVWSGQAGKHGVCLERAVLDETQAAVKRTSRTLVILVPGCESGDHQAGVGSLQRRMRSNVSRTRSAVSAGNSVSGTATIPLPRFFSCIGVEAISISRRPSLTRISRS